MNRRYLTLAALLPLAACAAGGVGPVAQIGKDSYTVRAISARSVSEAKQRALQSAQKACTAQKRHVMLIKEFSGTEVDTGEKYHDLTFLCVGQGDPDFRRVSREPMPASGE